MVIIISFIRVVLKEKKDLIFNFDYNFMDYDKIAIDDSFVL